MSDLFIRAARRLSSLTATTRFGAVALALILLFPYLGALPFALYLWRRRLPPSASRWWRDGTVALWGGFFGLLLIASALFHPTQVGTWLAQAFVVLFGVWLFRPPRQVVAAGVGGALVVIAVLLPVERALSAERWYRYGGANPVSLATVTEPQQLTGDTDRAPFERHWRIANDAPLVLSLRLRADYNPRGWDWFRYPDTITVVPHHEQGKTFSRIYFPTNGDNYVARAWYTNAPLGGERFRLTGALRLVAASTASERLTVTGSCRGLRLRAVGSDALACADAPLSETWQPVQLDWRVPEGVTVRHLRVAINNLDGYTVDVRDIGLEHWVDNRWHPLGPLAPPGIILSLHGPMDDTAGNTATYRVVSVTNEWNRYQLWTEPNLTSGDNTVRARLRVETGLSVLVDDVSLQQAVPTGRERPTPLPLPERQQLWFYHPNLAGHTVAALCLLGLLACRRRRDGLLVVLVSIVGLWFTESRTALAAVALGAGAWGWLRSGRYGRLVVIGVATVGGLGLGALWLSGSDVLLFERNTEQTPRPVVWRTAWAMFGERPWRGVGATFTDTFADMTPYNEVVAHAHNVWLELASRYGLLGLGAALLLTFGLPYLAWRRARGLGLAFTAPLLLTQVGDYTLFQSGVLFSLIIGLHLLVTVPVDSPMQVNQPECDE